MRTPERTTEWKKNHFPQLVGRGGWRLEGLDGPPVAGEFADANSILGLGVLTTQNRERRMATGWLYDSPVAREFAGANSILGLVVLASRSQPQAPGSKAVLGLVVGSGGRS